MAGVYHHREWVEIDGSTIISTSELRAEIEKSDGESEYVRGLEWVLNNATFVFKDRLQPNTKERS